MIDPDIGGVRASGDGETYCTDGAWMSRRSDCAQPLSSGR
jgi:hypothetical protein